MRVRELAAIIAVMIVIFIAVAVRYSFDGLECTSSYSGARQLNVKYTFSEFEEINGTGIYVSEVLEMRVGINECSNDDKIPLNWLDIYLLDNQGLTNFTENLWNLQDNYAGNISETVDLSAEIANDNGTEFPIHFENQIDNDFEKYGDGKLGEDELYLSVGDKIKVYGSGSEADGPAGSEWSVRIKFTPTADPLIYDLEIP